MEDRPEVDHEAEAIANRAKAVVSNSGTYAVTLTETRARRKHALLFVKGLRIGRWVRENLSCENARANVVL